MGTWGTAIFSDDTAADIRAEFTDHLGDGLTTPEATDRTLEGWQASITDPDLGPVIWLSLAATQWKLGRLEERVKKKALQIINEGDDLRRWEGKQREQRAKVLERLRSQLESKPPREKKVPQRFLNHCEWGVGELIAYSTLSGEKVLFRVIGYHEDRGGKSPICELLNWQGRELPGMLRLRFLGVKTRAYPGGEVVVSQFMIGRTAEREIPEGRVERVGIRLSPSQKPGGYSVFLWRSLDRQLQEVFGVV